MTTINLCALLGDIGANGAIETSATANSGQETSVGNIPYVLVAAGPDGAFGPTGISSTATMAQWIKNKDALRQCDDITNFPR